MKGTSLNGPSKWFYQSTRILLNVYCTGCCRISSTGVRDYRRTARCIRCIYACAGSKCRNRKTRTCFHVNGIHCYHKCSKFRNNQYSIICRKLRTGNRGKGRQRCRTWRNVLHSRHMPFHRRLSIKSFHHRIRGRLTCRMHCRFPCSFCIKHARFCI